MCLTESIFFLCCTEYMIPVSLCSIKIIQVGNIFPVIHTYTINKSKLRIQLSIGQSVKSLFMAEVNTSANIRLSACMLPKHHQLMALPEVRQWPLIVIDLGHQLQIKVGFSSSIFLEPQQKWYLKINTGSLSPLSKRAAGSQSTCH